jgi:hypothetical protein
MTNASLAAIAGAAHIILQCAVTRPLRPAIRLVDRG